MAETIRSKGTTSSESYLARLADRTFLNLWAWPNVYRDVIVNGKRTGKELCDLLVVCGDHVIIFSDKNIKWSVNKSVDIAWSRWYKKAIGNSVHQVRGAERWIENNPERIFLDAACTKPLPIRLPPAESRKIHGVVVALGAHKACSDFFAGDSGSFMIRPDIIGQAHHDPFHDNFFPFTIGDVDPAGSFIHVVNDVTLDILMKELDTVTDFTDYLDSKASFIRSGNLGNAAGEEELLSYYLTHMVDEDHHGFSHPKNIDWTPLDSISIDIGHYDALLKNPQFLSKKNADRNSYIWDRLIEAFTENMLAGTTIVRSGTFNITEHEEGVRHMALEPRVMRRLLGDGISEVLKKAHLHDKTFRSMIPSPNNPRDGTAYAFMTFALPKKQLAGGYEQYRKVRSNILTTYCLAMLKKFPHIKRIIGIACEPPHQRGDQLGGSEDMLLAKQLEWTPELIDDLKKDCEDFGVMKEGVFNMSNWDVTEYPDVEVDDLSASPMNRQQRRAWERKQKKKR